MLVYVLFYLGQLSHFPSCCGAGVTNWNEPPSSFLLPPHYCGLGAGSIPFRAIVNNKQCEMRGLFMSLVIHYWLGDVQDCQGVSASEMTCIVSSGALNSTHSLRFTTSKVMVIVWRLRGNIVRTVLYCQHATSLMGTVNKKQFIQPGWALSFSLCFLSFIIFLYVCVCFVLPWTVESFPFVFWPWRNKLKWAPFDFFASSPLFLVRSWLHPS